MVISLRRNMLLPDQEKKLEFGEDADGTKQLTVNGFSSNNIDF